MNVMEYLERVLGDIVIPDLGRGGATELFSQMEVEMREGIAQEIEQLVVGGEVPRFHGIPTSAAYAQNPFELQQDVMRGAANVIRGKDPATEEDWLRQQERLKAMAQLRDLQRGASSVLIMPGELAENADIPPMPSDADLQRKFDDREDRLREYND